MTKKFRRLSIKRGVRARQRVKRVKQHPLMVPVATFFGLLIITAASFGALNGRMVRASNSKVIQLFVDGKTQVLPTQAATVGDFLKRLNVRLEPQDVVEPAKTAVITDDNFKINVYRARPVTIVDNGKKITALTAQSEPREVAQKAGLTIYPEDKVDAVKNDEVDPTNPVLGQKVVIDRATPVSMNLYGTPVQVRTHAKTVGDVLKEKNVQPHDGDVISPAPTTPVTNSTQVFVVRKGKKVDTTEEVIPAPVQYTDDSTLSVGTTVVRQQGSDGKKVVTYEVDLENDKEIGRKALQEVVAVQPVAQVIARGAKVVYSNPSSNVELGRQIAADMGVADEFSCIYNIFDNESKWSTTASNPSGAYGIPQALPGSKMGPGWQTDPAVQIRWGIGYMIDRYGGPCAAWHHWQGARSY